MDIQSKIDELQKWIKTQPQLPQKIENSFLKAFLLSKDGDIEAAKQRLQYHFEFRLKHQNFFINRDPLDKATQESLQVENFLLLPGRTYKNYKLLISRLNDYDPAKYIFDDVVRTFFMMLDMFLIMDDGNSDGEMVIFDMTGVTLRHQLKASLSTVRMYMQAVQTAYPLRLKQVHVINASALIHVIMKLIKPFMQSELVELLQFHLPNSEKPFEDFPQDMLPDEYGGKSGKVKDLRKYWIDRLMEKRDYIADKSRWKLNSQ